MEALSCAGLWQEERLLMVVIILGNTLAVVFLGLCGRGVPRGARREKDSLLATRPLGCVSGRCKRENERILWNGHFWCRIQRAQYMLSCGVSGMPLHGTKRPVFSPFTEKKSVQMLVCSAPLERSLLSVCTHVISPSCSHACSYCIKYVFNGD